MPEKGINERQCGYNLIILAMKMFVNIAKNKMRNKKK